MAADRLKRNEVREVFSLLWASIKPYKGINFSFCFCILIQVAFLIMMPLVYRSIFDDAIVHKNITLLLSLAFLLLAGLLIKTMADMASEYLLARLAIHIETDMRLNLFQKLQDQELPYFQATPSGKIISHFTNDLSAFYELIKRASFISKYILLGTLAIALLFVFQWQLAFICLILLTGSILVSKQLEPYIKKINEKRNECVSDFIVSLNEFLIMQLIIRLYNLKAFWIEYIKSKLTSLASAAVVATNFGIIIPRFFIFTTGFIEILIVLISAYMVIQGQLTVGTIVAFLALFGYLRTITENVIFDYSAVMAAISGIERVRAVLFAPTRNTQLPSLSSIQKIPLVCNSITLQQVNFCYSDRQQVLHDINLTIPARQFIAFVGPNGSGKSTLIALLLGLYKPQQGKIFYDDTNIEDLNELSFREQISVVLQDSLLFNRSIRENIRMGRLNATDEEIKSVMENVGLHETVMGFSEGYDTIVGERGALLSGGQRQRMALARALIRNPSLLLLDEVTSGLDPIADAEICELIASFANERTVIMVAHRLKSVIHADHLFVLNEGRLVESGTHHALLKQNGLYAKLWQSQHAFMITRKGMPAINTFNLRTIPMLEQCDENFLVKLASLFILEYKEAGTSIFEEGNNREKFYLIAQGRVAVSKTNSDEGTEHLITILEQGDYFGGLTLLNNNHELYVKAMTECKLFVLAQENSKKLLAEYPEMHKLIYTWEKSRAFT